MSEQAAPAAPWRRLLSALAAAFCLFVLFCEITENTADPDLFVYLLYGREALSARALPDRDPFSYLPTLNPWIFPEWAPSILFYTIYRDLGPEALQFLKYGLWALMLLFIWLVNRARNTPLLFTLPVVLASLYLISLSAAPVRIQVFTFVFLAAAAWLWESARASGKTRRLLLLPPLFLAWANCHAGFAFGLALCFFYAADALIGALKKPETKGSARLPVLVFAACGLAALANPFGFKLISHVFAHAADPEMHISEWQPLWAAASRGAVWQAAAFLCLALCALLLAPAALRRDRPGLALVVLSAYMGLAHYRHASLFALCAALYLPAWAAGPGSRIAKSLRAPALLALIFPLFATAFMSYANMQRSLENGSPLALLTPSTPAPLSRTLAYPLNAVGFLAARGFSGRLCVQYDYAAFALWYLYPRARTALDSRCENVFPKDVRESYFAFLDAGPGWQDFLYRFPADGLLLGTNTRLSFLLERQPGWAVAHRDRTFTVFLRRSFAR